jgi:hypothetical protein
MLSIPVRPELVEPKASEHPFVLSLSKDTYRREAWFDKLTTNGPYAQPLPFKGGELRLDSGSNFPVANRNWNGIAANRLDTGEWL